MRDCWNLWVFAQLLAHGPITAQHQNSSNPPQSLIGTSCHICSKTLFIYRCLVETVNLNFHLETYATLDHNLDSGLCLELQVCCNLVSRKPLTDIGLPQGFPAGGAYASYSKTFHEFIKEHSTLTDCDV